MESLAAGINGSIEATEQDKNMQEVNKKNIGLNTLTGLFSVLLSAAIILGRHLHVTSPYDARIDENYLTPYSPSDLILFTVLVVGIFFLSRFLISLLREKSRMSITFEKHCLKGQTAWMFLCTAILLLCWLPWLLYYYPGFVFPDSYKSLEQALGQVALNNHHPVLYTLLLKLCLWIGGCFQTGDITAGCAIYSFIQMLCMAGAFSYLFCWCRTRFSLRSSWWTIGFVVLFGLNPYIAQDSIAMWKDPLFSAAVMIWSLFLCDLGLSHGKASTDIKWTAAFICMMLLVLFLRNNGFLIVLSAAALLFLLSVRGKAYRRAFVVTVAGFFLWALITVPGYKLLGIGTPKEETVGPLLNQAARVVVYEGKMSAEDREFLGELMPLEHYREAYRPCCVDLFKWDEQFNREALAGSGFLRTWSSLLKKNPRLCFEAWEMETYGFWTVERPEINLNTKNISAGDPYNTGNGSLLEIGDKRLQFQNLLHGSFWQRLLPLDFWSPPLGIIFWLILFAAVCFLTSGRKELLLLVFPSLGGLLSLILSSPIWYLARYGAFAQFLLPVFIFAILSTNRKGDVRF